jgi:hypothetical protein
MGANEPESNIVKQLHEFQKQTSLERGMQSTADMSKLLFAFRKSLMAEGFTQKEAMELTRDYFNAVMASQLANKKEE